MVDIILPLRSICQRTSWQSRFLTIRKRESDRILYPDTQKCWQYYQGRNYRCPTRHAGELTINLLRFYFILNFSPRKISYSGNRGPKKRSKNPGSVSRWTNNSEVQPEGWDWIHCSLGWTWWFRYSSKFLQVTKGVPNAYWSLRI